MSEDKGKPKPITQTTPPPEPLRQPKTPMPQAPKPEEATKTWRDTKRETPDRN
jgi:hypothetical protein